MVSVAESAPTRDHSLAGPEADAKLEKRSPWRSDQPPPFEGDDDGYPTEEWIEALAAHVMTPHAAARFLVEGFPIACEGISCCGVTVEDKPDRFDDAPGKEITFWTGGWSGAEDLIGTMLQQFSIRHFHTRWEAGGLYVFYVRDSMLRSAGDGTGGAPSPRSQTRDEPESLNLLSPEGGGLEGSSRADVAAQGTAALLPPEAEVAGGWQHIATAPKTQAGEAAEIVILGFAADEENYTLASREGFWRPDVNRWVSTLDPRWADCSQPTHWQPLPAPPERPTTECVEAGR